MDKENGKSKMFRKYMPEDFDESLAELRRFQSQREDTKTFKPMPIAECRLARTCQNCIYNKGSPIHEMNEFLGYGRAFYYGFLACTLEGRTADKCRVTTSDAVCRHHRFERKGIGGKTLPLPLSHLKRCMDERVKKQNG